MGEGVLQVSVRSRQGLVFSGELASVTSFNAKGEFDVLPMHTNFVSMIAKKVILRKVGGKKEEINLNTGVMMVEKNEVKVFLGVGMMG